jgi:hypothetical protein
METLIYLLAGNADGGAEVDRSQFATLYQSMHLHLGYAQPFGRYLRQQPVPLIHRRLPLAPASCTTVLLSTLVKNWSVSLVDLGL